jgi:hypothetical protein
MRQKDSSKKNVKKVMKKFITEKVGERSRYLEAPLEWQA